MREYIPLLYASDETVDGTLHGVQPLTFFRERISVSEDFRSMEDKATNI